MNEVRELCERALDGPEPPLRDGAEMLAVARRATGRRNRRRLASGMAAVAALAAGTALAAPQVVVGASGPAPAPPIDAASPPPAAAPAPTVEEAVAHVPRIAELVADAVPEGYVVRPIREAADEAPSPETPDAWSPWYLELDDGSYALTATMLVSEVDRTGALQVVIRGGRPAPSGDLCDPEIGAGLAEPPGAQCQLVPSAEGPIRLITGQDETRGEVRAATRFLADGYLTVVAEQAVAPDPSGSFAVRPLAAPPLTAQQLAALVSDPALLP